MNDKWSKHHLGSRLYYCTFLLLFIIMNIILFIGNKLPDSYIEGMFVIMYLVMGYFLSINSADVIKNGYSKIKSLIKRP